MANDKIAKAQECCDDAEFAALVLALYEAHNKMPRGAPGDNPLGALNWAAIIASLPQLFALISGWFSGKPATP